MMHMDLFNVVEKGTSRVYRLMYAPEGLYLFYTSHIDGQQTYAGGAAELRSNAKEAKEYMDALAKGEEPLSEQMTAAMLKHEHSRYLAWNQIQNVGVGPDEHLLTLRTNDGTIELDLRNSPPDHIARFIGLLRDAVRLEHAGEREMGEE